MRVGNYNPFLSDHCPLSCELKANSKSVECTPENLQERPIQFHFRQADKEKLIETLKSDEFSSRLNPSNWNKENISAELVTKITDALIDATKTARIKPKLSQKNATPLGLILNVRLLRTRLNANAENLNT